MGFSSGLGWMVRPSCTIEIFIVLNDDIHYPFPPRSPEKISTRPPRATEMSLYTLPIRLTYPIITCRVSPATAPTVASPPTPPSLLPLATSATAVPSLTCALQCPHFESYAPFSRSKERRNCYFSTQLFSFNKFSFS